MTPTSIQRRRQHTTATISCWKLCYCFFILFFLLATSDHGINDDGQPKKAGCVVGVWSLQPAKVAVTNPPVSAASLFSRRQTMASLVAAVTSGGGVAAAFAKDTTATATAPAATYAYERRDRKNNKDVLIREDYWYMTGNQPPRQLEVSLRGDDPKWNAFGTCESSVDGENSCTYVSLKQRIPAYKKYAGSIAYGADEYKKLGQVLQNYAAAAAAAGNNDDDNNNNKADSYRQEAISYVETPREKSSYPPAIVDSETKMVLFATQMMTSPNFPIPSRQLLVARFYANESRFAAQEMLSALRDRDAPRALAAWEFGKDSWNSFFVVVNPTILPKVGDKFSEIS